MGRKAQSVFEYLVTYIWAILLIVIVIAIILATGILNVNFLQSYAAPGSCRVDRLYGPESTQVINLVGVCNNQLPQFVLTSRGVGDFVQIPKSNAPGSILNITNNVTITAWVYVHGTPYHDIVDKEGQFGMKLNYNNAPHACTPSNSKGWCLEWDTSDNWTGQSFPIPGLSDNQWVFLAVTQQASPDGAIKSWYANGNLIGNEMEVGGSSAGSSSRCTLNNQGKNLRNANFSGCDLQGANFRGADVQDANFAGAVLITTNFAGANLQNADLQCVGASGVNFNGANLQNANMANSILTEANFNRADVQYTNFAGSNLTGANFRGANMHGATFSNSTSPTCPAGVVSLGGGNNLAYADSIFTIGAISPGYTGYGEAEWFNGSISNVQIYNTSIAANGIYLLYQEGIGGAPIDLRFLQGWWPLNGDAKDYSGNNQGGVVINQSFYGDRSWSANYTPP